MGDLRTARAGGEKDFQHMEVCQLHLSEYDGGDVDS